MTTREKTLAGVVGVAFLGIVSYLSISKVFVAKSDERDQEIKKLADEYEKLQNENLSAASRKRQYAQWAALTFDADEFRAAAKLGADLMRLVEQAGLSPANLSLQPVQGARVRGIYKEIGRTIRVRGKLANIVNFLYLLRKEPHLHRVDNVTINPEPKSNEAELQARYVTLVIEPLAGKAPAASQPSSAPASLDTEERRLFDGIVSRDLFRPYVQRRPEPIAAPPPPRPQMPARPQYQPRRSDPPPRPPVVSQYRVVGLPDWNSRHDVVVADSGTGQIRVYNQGDTLGGGAIRMVDYRPMPSPTNPQILSPSRVILHVGPDFYAVELGEDLSAKRLVKREDLPPELQSEPTSKPAEAAKGPTTQPAEADKGPTTKPADKVKQNATPER